MEVSNNNTTHENMSAGVTNVTAEITDSASAVVETTNVTAEIVVSAATSAVVETKVNTCTGCGRADSKSQCSRCDEPYCDRECQVKHWPEHKKTCLPTTAYKNRIVTPAAYRDRLIAQLFDKVCKIIAGNVMILNAWYRLSCGRVEIEITETLVDFSQPGTHFLHMKYVDIPESTDCKYSDPSRCFIKFILVDHEYESVVSIKIPASAVKAKQTQPSREWTLMYDL
jgi:MYND finger